MSLDNINDYSTTAGSNSDIGGSNIAENCLPGGINNALRELCAQLRREIANQGSDITAAATTNIAATGTSGYVKITGTTTITSFGTPNGHPRRWIQWGAATPVTYNGTSMILLGAASRTHAAGDIGVFVHEGSGNWRELAYFPGGVVGTKGLHKVWVPADAMTPATTNGAAPGLTETATNKHNFRTLDYDTTTQEFASFSISMPSSWNEGTVSFVPVWTFASSSGGVVWALQGVATSNDDAMDVAYGTEQTSTDTALTAGDLHRGPASSAITIGGTPAANDTVLFRIKRNVSDGSDTLGADAKLVGVELYFTTDAEVDVTT